MNQSVIQFFFKFYYCDSTPGKIQHLHTDESKFLNLQTSHYLDIQTSLTCCGNYFVSGILQTSLVKKKKITIQHYLDIFWKTPFNTFFLQSFQNHFEGCFLRWFFLLLNDSGFTFILFIFMVKRRAKTFWKSVTTWTCLRYKFSIRAFMFCIYISEIREQINNNSQYSGSDI